MPMRSRFSSTLPRNTLVCLSAAGALVLGALAASGVTTSAAKAGTGVQKSTFHRTKPKHKKPSPGEGDPPEVTIGERLFLETRFSQFFAAASAGGSVNTPLVNGDPVLDFSDTTS